MKAWLPAESPQGAQLCSDDVPEEVLEGSEGVPVVVTAMG